MILIVDNYDSFTHNLVQYVGESGEKIKIVRNDKSHLTDLQDFKPTHIIISPGPGYPQKSGISIDIIKLFGYQTPILGVCLGHQSIGYVYGGKIKKLQRPVHGKVSAIYHNQQDLFSEIPNPFQAARYHSLIIDSKNLPDELTVTATTKEGIIMACQHKKYPSVHGIQFHPESLWTEYGKKIIQNFLIKKPRQSFAF